MTALKQSQDEIKVIINTLISKADIKRLITII